MPIHTNLRFALLTAVLLGNPVSAWAQQKIHPSSRVTTEVKARLLTQALKLRKGDSFETVIKSMGKPTLDELLSKKESSKIIGRELRYYLVRWEDGLVNERNDELISVWLDASNFVKSISIRTTLFTE